MNVEGKSGTSFILLIRLTDLISAPANSSRAVKHEKVGYEERFRPNRELFAKLGMRSSTCLPWGSFDTENPGSRFTDADLLEILRHSK